MKEKIKNILLNSMITFLICFFALLIYQFYQDIEYYSVYSIEELAEMFSSITIIKEKLLWNINSSLYWSIRQMIIFVPILMILEMNTNIKNNYKILITICLTGIISVIYILSHLIITF